MSGSTQVRAQLQHLVMKYGRNLAKEPKRIRAMLLDTCGVHKREVRLLTLMVEEGLTQILLRDLGSVSAAIVLPRMVDQLHTEFAIDRELAEWTVSTWSEVLGWGPAASEAIGTVETPPSPHQTLQSGFKSVSAPASGVPETLQKPELIFRDKLRDGSEGPGMIVIPAGEFRMGDSSGKNYFNERPVHPVRFAQPFALGVYAVTFEEYDRFAQATGRGLPKDNDYGRDRFPVINVSWNDAVAYCLWLSDQTGQSYHLPSEAEWEYACRAGTTTEYSWGDAIGHDNANCDGCGSQWDRKQTAPVGSFSPNPWGLFDMHGNVWEWCIDCWHDGYDGAPTDGSAWIYSNNCDSRVYRGGSSLTYKTRVRSSFRHHSSPESRNCNIGFRLKRLI